MDSKAPWGQCLCYLIMGAIFSDFSILQKGATQWIFAEESMKEICSPYHQNSIEFSAMMKIIYMFSNIVATSPTWLLNTGNVANVTKKINLI